MPNSKADLKQALDLRYNAHLIVFDAGDRFSHKVVGCRYDNNYICNLIEPTQEVYLTQNIVNRRLAAILAADMVGYSRLMQLDEAGVVARQSDCLKELVLPAIKEFGGRLVKTTGDGYLVEFHSAVDAVSCGVKIQREMVGREQDVPVDQKHVYRIGINVGEIIYGLVTV